MNATVRTVLTVLAVAAAGFAAADPVGVPTWVSVVVASLAAGLAAVGLIPPQMLSTDLGHNEVFIRRRGVKP